MTVGAPFAGRVAVISGAASGIGAATARLLTAGGIARLHLVDVDVNGLQRVADELNAHANVGVTHALDVSDARSWELVRDTVATDMSRLDVLINNAYTARVLPLVQQSPDDWERQIGVNVTSLFHSMRSLHGLLAASRGTVVNVASVHAFVGIPGYAAYAASKGAVVSLSRQLAVEYGPTIRVNTISPGPVLTGAWENSTEAERESAANATALGRLGRPEEVAAAICFLASDEASFITGTNLTVDGGWLATKDSP